MTAFGRWRRELDYRVNVFLRARHPEPIQDPERRFGLTTEDYALLGEMERAFQEAERESKKHGR